MRTLELAETVGGRLRTGSVGLTLRWPVHLLGWWPLALGTIVQQASVPIEPLC